MKEVNKKCIYTCDKCSCRLDSRKDTIMAYQEAHLCKDCNDNFHKLLPGFCKGFLEVNLHTDHARIILKDVGTGEVIITRKGVDTINVKTTEKTLVVIPQSNNSVNIKED